VTQDAAARSGLDPSVLKQMLPMLAMLVAGFMAKQQSGGVAPPQAAPSAGPLGDLLGGLLGGGAFGGAPGGGGMGGALGSGGPAAGPMPGGLSGLGALLDMNGDGNALDDILRMASKAMR
jgi:hypothetical protein